MTPYASPQQAIDQSKGNVRPGQHFSPDFENYNHLPSAGLQTTTKFETVQLNVKLSGVLFYLHWYVEGANQRIWNL